MIQPHVAQTGFSCTQNKKQGEDDPSCESTLLPCKAVWLLAAAVWRSVITPIP